MNAAVGPAARAAGLALLIVLAAALGPAAGDVLTERTDMNGGANMGGIVPDAAALSRIAIATFSTYALQAVPTHR